MPFDWTTPLGYFITLLIQCILAYYTVLFLTPTLCFLCGSCFLLKSFVDDVTNDLRILNDKKMEKILCNTVQYHSELVQLSSNFAVLIQKFLQNSRGSTLYTINVIFMTLNWRDLVLAVSAVIVILIVHATL